MNAIVQSALSPNPLSSFWNVGQKLTCASRTRTHDDRGSKLYPRLRESPELLTQPHQRCTQFSEREERGAFDRFVSRLMRMSDRRKSESTAFTREQDESDVCG